MRMTIEGIGKVPSATVPLDGITVVAGENNTGKSTIGKALFAMADGCYDLEQRMIERIRRHIVFAVNSQLPLTGDESLGSRHDELYSAKTRANDIRSYKKSERRPMRGNDA